MIQKNKIEVANLPLFEELERLSNMHRSRSVHGKVTNQILSELFVGILAENQISKIGGVWASFVAQGVFKIGKDYPFQFIRDDGTFKANECLVDLPGFKPIRAY